MSMADDLYPHPKFDVATQTRSMVAVRVDDSTDGPVANQWNSRAIARLYPTSVSASSGRIALCSCWRSSLADHHPTTLYADDMDRGLGLIGRRCCACLIGASVALATQRHALWIGFNHLGHGPVSDGAWHTRPRCNVIAFRKSTITVTASCPTFYDTPARLFSSICLLLGLQSAYPPCLDLLPRTASRPTGSALFPYRCRHTRKALKSCMLTLSFLPLRCDLSRPFQQPCLR